MGWLSLLRRRGSPNVAAEPGVRHGRLTPCPKWRNCVSSYADDGVHAVDPLSLPVDADVARQRLLHVLGEWRRAYFLQQGPRYLRFECYTLLGLPADLEVLIDEEAGCVHVRSASRFGIYDFGTNRRRVERLRHEYLAALQPWLGRDE